MLVLFFLLKSYCRMRLLAYQTLKVLKTLRVFESCKDAGKRCSYAGLGCRDTGKRCGYAG